MHNAYFACWMVRNGPEKFNYSLGSLVHSYRSTFRVASDLPSPLLPPSLSLSLPLSLQTKVQVRSATDGSVSKCARCPAGKGYVCIPSNVIVGSHPLERMVTDLCAPRRLRHGDRSPLFTTSRTKY